MTRKSNPNATNENGLTLGQWVAAVGIVPILDAPKLKAAWQRGEDPSDWRAHYAAQEAKR